LCGAISPQLSNENEHALAKSSEPLEEGMIRASDVAPREITWLWPGRIPRGCITLLDGDPGAGKTTVALTLAAGVSTGRPCTPGAAAAPARGVLVYTCEDSAAATLRPRIAAAGADLDRVWFETSPATIGDLAPELEKQIRQHAAGLVVFDPLIAYMGVNDKNYQAAHRALAPLRDIAERTETAIILIRHPTKAPRRALHAGMGSVGIVGIARSALFAARDPEDGDEFVLAQTKNSLGRNSRSVRYRIDDNGILAFGDECDISADDLLRAQTRPGPRPTARLDAEGVLKDILAAGPVHATEVRERAGAAGVSDRTLERAKDALGVRSMRVVDADNARWMWALPPRDGEDRHVGDGDLEPTRFPQAEDRLREPGDLAVDAPPDEEPHA
jgi:hypothetical protein